MLVPRHETRGRLDNFLDIDPDLFQNIIYVKRKDFDIPVVNFHMSEYYISIYLYIY